MITRGNPFLNDPDTWRDLYANGGRVARDVSAWDLQARQILLYVFGRKFAISYWPKEGK